MDEIGWALGNLGVGSAHELSARGLSPHVAPNVPRGVRIVNLADGRAAGAEAYGVAQKAIHEAPAPFMRSGGPTPDDVTLARTVESEIFRGSDVDKGRVNVSAENGVVVLIGEVDRPDQIEALAAAARAIPGVQGVDNLLHLPGTPAPTKRHMIEAR